MSKKHISEEVGARLAEARTRIGDNQTDFAQKLGLKNYQSWQGYEKGLKSPKIDMIYRIAELTNTSVDWLVSGNGPTSSAVSEARLGEAFDSELMKLIVVSIEGWLEDTDQFIPAEKKAQLFILLYNKYRGSADEVSTAEIIEFTKIAAQTR